MPASNDKLGRSAGFTLIEVLIALVIITLALGAVAEVFAGARAGHDVAADVDQAIAIANRQLAVAGSAAVLHTGDDQGVASSRFAWRLAIEPYYDTAATGQTAFDPTAIRLYRITVTVAWGSDRGARHITLSTLRLVAAAR
jgi:general secretion pathway protein I